MNKTEIFMTPLETAIAAAVMSHHKQIDKVGQAYILHPLRVMLALQPQGELAMIVGVLHDVVEDTSTTLAEIEEMLGKEVAEGVDVVSQRKETETYWEFIQRVAKHTVGRLVKIEDIRDNMNPERRVGRPDLDGLMERYAKALEELGAEG